MTMSHANLRPVPPSPARRIARLDLPGQTPLQGALWMPFESGRHPATDAIGGENLEWLRAHGLLDERNVRVFERARFHELAGRVYHRQDRQGLRLTADFIAALFVLDDLMDTNQDSACRDAARAQSAVDVVRRASRSGRPPEHRSDGIDCIAAAMADLTGRLTELGVPTGAYLNELDVYFDGVVEEARRRARGFSSVDDYAGVRVAFSAVYACIELGLALEGRSLPPALRPLAHAANLSVSWINDVYSWPKERALGETSNLIAVIAQQRGIGEEEAFHQACLHCDRVVFGYLEARDAIRSDDREALGLLESWMQGNSDWHAVATARYNEHLSVAPTPEPRRTPRAQCVWRTGARGARAALHVGGAVRRS